MPWTLERMADVAPPEVFVLAIAALALGLALASERVGLSIAFGAFLAGMMVSEIAVSHSILEKLLPARDVFAALFFVSVGMFIDPKVLADNAALVVSFLAIIVAGKGLIAFVLIRLTEYGKTTGLALAGLAAQAGEFSFVVAGVGLDRSAMDIDVFSLIVAATAISMALTPGVTLIVSRGLRRIAPEPVAAS